MTSPPGGQARHVVILFHHLVHGESLFGKRAGGADLHTLAAVGATGRLRPRAVHVADNHAADTARADVPDVRAFHLLADANAARTQDAAVVVQHVAGMRVVHRELRVGVWIAHMGHAEALRHGLQLAMVIGNADGALVIAFAEEELDGNPPVLRQLFGVGGDRHTVLYRSGAGGQQAAHAGYFHDAEAGGPDG